MKHVMYGIVTTMLVLASILSVMVVTTRSAKQQELEEAVGWATKETIRAIENEQYHFKTNDEAYDFLEKQLSSRIKTDEEGESFTIKNHLIDIQKEIVFVDVERTFKYPNGKSKTIEAKKTAVVERDIESEAYLVLFKKDSNIWKEYTQHYGEKIKVPKTQPSQNGLWTDENGNALDCASKVKGNVTYTWKENI